MKTTPLTVRRVPKVVHDTLKNRAKANHRSINGETLTWLERQAQSEKVVTCAQAAEILEAFDALLSDSDRKQIAEGIERARRKMNAERLEER
ncbi:MAG: FitA-like ribbon-helix-helix domain-containing protein, partial [Limisphaerales bacterium]